MVKSMKIAIVSVVVIIALTFVIGLFLPKQRRFVKQAEFRSSAQRIYQVVTDFAHQASWRNDVREIKVIDESMWTEIPQKGTPLTFKIKRKVEPSLFEIEIIEPKDFNGSWVGTFEQTPTGTTVTFTEVIVIENPFFRVFSLIAVDLDKIMEEYMHNLKQTLGE